MWDLERYHSLSPNTVFSFYFSGDMEFTFLFFLSSVLTILSFQVSFTEEYLRENIGAFMSSLLLAKPTGLKKCKWHKLLMFPIVLFMG